MFLSDTYFVRDILKYFFLIYFFPSIFKSPNFAIFKKNSYLLFKKFFIPVFDIILFILFILGILAGVKIASYECEKFSDEKLVRVIALSHVLQVNNNNDIKKSDNDLLTAYCNQYNEEITVEEMSSCLQKYQVEVDRYVGKYDEED